MSLIQCGDIARGIEMVGDLEVHDWISLSDRLKDFLVSMFNSGGGGNSHRLGYGMCHFLRVLFWMENKFLGLFYYSL